MAAKNKWHRHKLPVRNSPVVFVVDIRIGIPRLLHIVPVLNLRSLAKIFYMDPSLKLIQSIGGVRTRFLSRLLVLIPRFRAFRRLPWQARASHRRYQQRLCHQL